MLFHFYNSKLQKYYFLEEELFNYLTFFFKLFVIEKTSKIEKIKRILIKMNFNAYK